MEERKTFDFKKNNVEIITLDELKRTYKENDIWGKPLRGMYHYDIIDNIYNILIDNGLQVEIDEIFAAQNKGKNPGVVKNPEIEKKYGENSIESHVLRRVYTTLRVKDFDNDELTTGVAIAFHQNKIQLAYGPNVKICHNQCILSPQRVFSTDRQKTIHDIIRDFKESMHLFEAKINEDKEFIEQMKQYPMNANQILQTIGIFSTMRVQHDTQNQSIRSKNMYPLNDGQISKFVEDMLILQKEKEEISLWDMYNVATNLFKADRMAIPSMFPQHLVLNDYIHQLIA